MTFLYRYQDGAIVREERIKASSEADAYSLLRKSGVRPMKVWPAPGILNRISALGKRGLAIVVLSVVCGVLSLVLYSAFHNNSALSTTHPALSAQPRHPIYGDPALMSEIVATGFASVFEEEGERLLAYYAQPGQRIPVPAALKRSVLANKSLEILSTNPEAQSTRHKVQGTNSDPREVQELKSIVLGMKDELREYLANGVGTAESYLRRLDERQVEEISIYEREANALKNIDDPAEYERVNAGLRRLGLRTIPVSRGEK